MRKIFSIVSALSIVTVSLFAQTEVSITATKDNTIYSEDGNVSNGAGSHFFSGKTNSGNIRRALVQFDLTGKIPSNATITSTKLKLNMSKTIAGDQSITIHKVMAEWGEGTSAASGNEGGGVLATTNDATWTHRIFNSQQWTSQGGDFIGSASANTTIGSSGSFQFGSTPEMVSDVQGWLANSLANFGWLIKGNESANATTKRFDSHEESIDANHPTLIVSYTTPTSVEQNTVKPIYFSLEQNYPNPFNPSTVIRYSIPVNGHVSLKVFDLLGKEIAALMNETSQAGTFSREWDASGLPSGIYFYRLQSGNNVSTKKLLITK